jgi:uncharacterized protein with NAD-binding domain and iron-sulfur cluster
MAGLATAHELIERGFRVTVFEPVALGGKARSIPKPRSARGGRKNLPGEHGFRFFPGFYHHVPDSMRRIPVKGNVNGVHDNMVDAPMAVMSFAGSEDISAPFGFTPETPGALTPESLLETTIGASKLAQRVPPHELAEFMRRMHVFFSSCEERRYGQWEHVPWMEFVKAEGKSQAYRDLLAKGLTRALVAAKEDIVSARTIGNMAEAFTVNFSNRGNDGAPDRVLNAPTNEAWIRPWVRHLRSLGVRFEIGYRATALRMAGGRVTEAVVRRDGRDHRVVADHFVCAMPAERAVKLWNRKVLALDPELALIDELVTDWMVGIQFFLRRNAPLTAGHMAYMDSPWALTSINQQQFWDGRDLPRDYGDGSVKDILSVDVSDWDTPGIVFGKPAKRCSKAEVAREVWEQLKASVNDGGKSRLRDEDLHSFFLDPGVRWSRRLRRNVNATPLLINTVGSWEKRPQAKTAISNLFLAGDYVQTNIDLATMESANESARVAVNALLDAEESSAERVPLWRLHQPEEYALAREEDKRRFAAGQPNMFDG